MKRTNEILQRLGISELNDMQEEAIGAILRTNNDVVILSPTGTGKTLAYLLPQVSLLQLEIQKKIQANSLRQSELQKETQIVTSLLQSDHQTMDADEGVVGECSPLAVVVVPGRELALQSVEVLRSMGCGLRGMALYGGRPTMEEHRTLRRMQPHIVFCTPGRLNDHIDKGNVLTERVRLLVVDEFDKCLEMGFQNEMARLLGCLPKVERRILLSATESEAIPRFVRMNRVERLDYRVEEEQISVRVHIHIIESPTPDKLETLWQLLLSRGEESSVVFLNYRESVERVAEYLRREGFTLSMFHGGLEQRQREAALYRFANGSANVLVCTDLASRGLDIPDIDNIIHYHLPETEQNYIHRTGRTARWDKQGHTYFILKAGEQLPSYVDGEPEVCNLPQMAADERPAAPRMVTVYIGKGKRDKLSRGDIVGFLCKKGGLQASEIGKISVEERYTYVAVSRHRLPELLRNVRGEKVKGMKTVVEEVA